MKVGIGMHATFRDEYTKFVNEGQNKEEKIDKIS